MLKNIEHIPLITIGITCFNSQDTVRRALRSAIEQNWKNLEIIIIDDASKDGSWEIIKYYSNQDNRIRAVQHKDNTGAAGSRNTIINMAKGSFVAFFDDDDESSPSRIRTQYEAICSHEREYGIQEIACYVSGKRIYSNGYELLLPAIGSQPKIPTGENVVDYLLYNKRVKGLFYGSGTPTCALMARLSTLRSVNGFDKNLRRVEDIDFAIKLALKGGHFIGCPEQLFVQYATFSQDKTPYKNLESELYLVDKYSTYLKKRNKYNYARDWFKLRFYHFNGKHFTFVMLLLLFLFCHPVSGIKHLLISFPARWVHERKMSHSQVAK